MADKIAVIGAGSWGTALANVLTDAGGDVLLWGRDKTIVAGINSSHENPKYLAGYKLSSSLKATADLAGALKIANVVFCSIPTQQVREVFSPHAALIRSKIVVNASKGIEMGTHACVSEIFREVCADCRYGVLSGPSFAQETVQRLPTAVTVASADAQDAVAIQKMLQTPYFRAYTSRDVCGVELGGALKNVVAIASGMVAGLGLGYNSQAALINRGIAEIMHLGRKKGAEPLTFLGLSGMGDLILTCTGPLSRNRKVGFALGEGRKLQDIQAELGGVAEGVFTARSAYEMGRQYGVDMPITEQVYRILYEGRTPQQAVTELMGRALKDEFDLGTNN